jgi:putative redox protein
MQIQCSWEEKMRFRAGDDRFQISMDGKPPFGDASALSPKQLLLASVCGCTGMDVVALLRKYKQSVEKFDVHAEANLTEGAYPVIFKSIILRFKLLGNIDADRLIEAVTLSQTKYCGVSAMVSKAVQIFYSIELNGVSIHEGQSHFQF